MNVGYGAVEQFGPADGELWTNYVCCTGQPHFKEVVSLDGSLCPNLVSDWSDLTDDDWENWADTGVGFFSRTLDYFLSRFDVPSNYQILAVVTHPTGAERLDDPRFTFIGYDLTEAEIGGSISALTNCGGFDKAFQPSDLSEYGLVTSFDKATQIHQALREQYPDEPHALCDMHAVWRMNGSDSTATGIFS